MGPQRRFVFDKLFYICALATLLPMQAYAGDTETNTLATSAWLSCDKQVKLAQARVKTAKTTYDQTVATLKQLEVMAKYRWRFKASNLALPAAIKRIKVLEAEQKAELAKLQARVKLLESIASRFDAIKGIAKRSDVAAKAKEITSIAGSMKAWADAQVAIAQAKVKAHKLLLVNASGDFAKIIAAEITTFQAELKAAQAEAGIFAGFTSAASKIAKHNGG